MIKNSPGDHHFLDVCEKWQLTKPLQFIRHLANFVYESARGDESLIVRITASDYRTKTQLQAELEWAHHLATQGVRVAAPVTSKNSLLIEEVEFDSLKFYVSVFKKAPGRFIQCPDDYTPKVFHLWGKTIGEMHRATESFKPSGAGRPHWCEDTMYSETMIGFKTSNEQPIRALFQDLLDHLNQKPKTPNIYNLIHADLHKGNFFYDGNDITFFDLDDSNYHWLAYDLGVALMNINDVYGSINQKYDPEAVRSHMLAGYVSVRPLPPQFEQDTKFFTTYRLALVYFWTQFHIRQARLGATVLERMQRFSVWAKAELLKNPRF